MITEKEFEYCITLVKSDKTSFVIACMYMYISLQSKYEEPFLSKLEITVSVLIKQYKNVCIVGDININVLSKNSVSLRFCNILKSHGLRYLIDFPTRTCDTAATAIDNNCITNVSRIK